MWKKLKNNIDRLNEGVGRAISWLTTILVVLVCFDVVIRYVFNDTQAWIRELEWHLFALIFILGAGYAFKHDRHVRVDVFYSNFTEREKAWVNLIGGLLLLLPWCLLITFYAFDFAMLSYKIGETSPDPGGLPALYIIKFSVCVGIMLLFLQGISSIIDCIDILKTAQTEKETNQ
ncbi:MAG: C4-dicarboxylate ABC transporter [Saprospiraceae bacterium]|nr:MAG: C4-dicarboxylate ABC transporter [Saprospiraceae bacterium]